MPNHASDVRRDRSNEFRAGQGARASMVVTLRAFVSNWDTCRLGMGLATHLVNGNRDLREALGQPNSIGAKPTVLFAISLRSRATSYDWQCVEANLARTLRTVQAQSYQRCRVIVCGHERPNIPELNRECVQWIEVGFDPPSAVARYNADKKAKRRVIGAALHKEGYEGYFMALDADDWLHRRAAEFFASSFERETRVLNSGFVVNLSHESASLRRRGFYYGCGSSAVFFFQRDDFPSSDSPAASEPLRFQLAIQSHQKILENLARRGERWQLIDIPLLAWVLGYWPKPESPKGEKVSGPYLWSRRTHSKTVLQKLLHQRYGESALGD